jgi:glycosyltransferase involved in cell wall biosynthesis
VISVIVPVRNAMPWLEEQLQAVIEQECSEPWEVIVVDNGSTDESRSVVQKWAARTDQIRLVDAPNAKGAGGARNAGVRAARGELLAFCDADDVVQPGWLASHVKALTEAEVVGGVFDVWSLNELPPPSPPDPIMPSAVAQFGFLPALISSNLALQRDVFDEVGGFADTMATGEDIDLSWRLELRGHHCVVNTGAVVARRDRPGFGGVFRRFVAYGRCGPVLYRKYRVHGLRSNPRVAAKTWVWLAVTTPRLVRPAFRPQWASIAGWRTGRLIESVRQRVFFP